MTPEIAAQIAAVHQRTVAQHTDWTGRLLLEAVCFRCYATYGLELECEDVLSALDQAAGTVRQAPSVQNPDQIAATAVVPISA